MSKHQNPNPNKPLFADQIRERERRRRYQVPFWQLLSFLLHGSVFVALVLFSPLREIVIPEPKAREPIKISADRLERLDEDLQTVRLNELLEQLNALQIVLHNMDVLKQAIKEDYDAFARNEQETARESIESLFSRILDEQASATEAQREALKAVTEVNQLRTERLTNTNVTQQIRQTLTEAAPAFARVDAAQAVAQNVLDRVFVEAELVGLVKTAAATEAVRNIQLQANTMQREFQRRFSNQARSMADYPTVLQTIEQQKQRLQEHEKNLETAKEKIVRQRADAKSFTEQADAHEKRLQAQQEQAEALRRDMEAATDGRAQTTTALAAVREKREATDDSEALDTEIDRLATAEKTFRETEKTVAERLKKLEADIRQTEKAVQDSRRTATNNADGVIRDERWQGQIEAAIEKTRGDIGHNEWRKTEIEKTATATTPPFDQGQKDAIAAQEALIKKVEEIAELARQEEAALKPVASAEFVPDPLTTQPIAQLDVVDAYAVATELEARITESYREIKSAEAAMLRKMSFQAAEKLTDVAKTVRPEIDEALLRTNPRDRQTFDRKQEATVEVVREADSMVETATTLLASARQIVQPELADTDTASDMPSRLERMYELVHLNEQLAAAAAEDADELAKDLTALMAAAPAGPEADLHPDKKVVVKTAALPPVPSATKAPEPAVIPPLSARAPDLIPGNIIRLDDTGTGVPTTWMYVNTWHVIGPFPNPDRVNLRRRFPPESVVDLEATYTGKDGRQITWEFEQARSSVRHEHNRAVVVPRSTEEYGIWYAYAEVFVDEACDLWIAVGSDDRSDLWLNDMHVWGSSNELKSWNIREGFRKVRFRKGRNRFLARIENGWHAMGWSVCIALTETPAL